MRDVSTFRFRIILPAPALIVPLDNYQREKRRPIFRTVRTSTTNSLTAAHRTDGRI